MLNDVGIKQVHISNLKNGRTFDVFELMKQWKLSFRLLQGRERTTQHIQQSKSIVLINTLTRRKEIVEFLKTTLLRMESLHLIVGCHNLLPCKEGLLNLLSHFPTMKVHVLTFTLRMATLVSDLSIKNVIAITPSVPFYLGPYQSKRPNGSTTILTTGSFDYNRRDYNLLKDAQSLKILLFPVTNTKAKLLNAEISSVSYGTLLDATRRAHFLLPLITSRTRNYNDYVYRGKLPSSIAISLASCLPLVLDVGLNATWGIPNQITHTLQTFKSVAQKLNYPPKRRYEKKKWAEAMSPSPPLNYSTQ